MKIVFLIGVILIAAIVNANTETEFERWQKQRKQAFNSYVSQQDQEFSQFLQQTWTTKKVETSQARVQVPKIPVPPVAPKTSQEKDESKVVDILPPKLTITPNTEKKRPQPLPADKPNSMPIQVLGHQLNIKSVAFAPLALHHINADSIAQAWQVISQNQAGQQQDSELTKTLAQYSTALNLDDWGRAYLTHAVLSKLNPNSSANERNLYTWYYLIQQGFDVRVGYDNNRIHLLLNVKQALYGVKFFRFGSDKYYFADFTGQVAPAAKVKTYEQQHAQAVAGIAIDLSKIPDVQGPLSERELQFNYLGKQYHFSVPYRQNYVELLNLYPQLEIEHYFQTGLQGESEQALLAFLAQAIQGKTEKQALNLLLRFVQHALPYQTDDQQFQHENFLLATETLHYPYADCEDRAVLYSFLVKRLLGNKIIGVLYQGHIATAVKTESEIEGGNYRVNGEKYMIADPTYIGASLGQVMPGYETQSPKMIVIN